MTSELQAYIEFDLDDAQQTLNEEKEQAEAEASIYLSPRDGETLLRIIPPPLSWMEWFTQQQKKPDPFFVLWKHFYERIDEPGQYVSVPCPAKMANMPCEICVEAARLKSSQDPVDNDLGEDMEAKHRFLMNVIDRDNEMAGPMIYEGSYPYRRWKGKSAYEKIRSLMTGRARVNLVTPSAEGYDLLIKKEGKGRKNTSYSFTADRTPRPLSSDPAQALEWINGQHDLRMFVLPPNPTQLAAILSGEAMNLQALENPQRRALPRGQTSGGGRAQTRVKQETAQDYLPDSTADEDMLQF